MSLGRRCHARSGSPRSPLNLSGFLTTEAERPTPRAGRTWLVGPTAPCHRARRPGCALTTRGKPVQWRDDRGRGVGALARPDLGLLYPDQFLHLARHDAAHAGNDRTSHAARPRQRRRLACPRASDSVGGQPASGHPCRSRFAGPPWARPGRPWIDPVRAGGRNHREVHAG
jgi:hypothetical protein